MKRLLAICGIAWMLVGCATTMRPVVYRPSATQLRFIEYKEGGNAGESRFVADGIRVCYESYSYRREFQRGNGFTLDYQIQTLPTADEWKKFWRVVDELNLAKWRSSYSQFDVAPGANGERMFVSDAGDWLLTVRTLDRSWKIRGEGSYPVAGHPERVAQQFMPSPREKNALEPLQKAFSDLIGLPHCH